MADLSTKQLRILKVLSEARGWVTRQEMEDTTGKKGFSKALGAPTRQIQPGNLPDVGLSPLVIPRLCRGDSTSLTIPQMASALQPRIACTVARPHGPRLGRAEWRLDRLNHVGRSSD